MLIAVCSVKGSPGVTTVALALAARWPDPQSDCVVVEADPAGGDVGVRFELPATPGLVSLAAAARRDTDPRLLWSHAQPLPGGLPVVVAPVGVEQTRAALAALGDDADVLRRAAERDGAVVVADCGRLDPGSTALPILRAADHILVMVRAHTPDLARMATRLAAIDQLVAGRSHLLLVGAGHPAGEVARELGVPVLGVIPEDRRGAAALGGHPGLRSRTPSRSALGRAAARIAAKLPAPAVATPQAEANADLKLGLDDGAGAGAAQRWDAHPRHGRLT